jgi:hypothetical protein
MLELLGSNVMTALHDRDIVSESWQVRPRPVTGARSQGFMIITPTGLHDFCVGMLRDRDVAAD